MARLNRCLKTAYVFLIYRLRSHLKNSYFGIHQGSKHLGMIKALGHLFLGRFATPDETLELAFSILLQKVWLNAVVVFDNVKLKSLKTTALCFASDDPPTSCLFTNTTHVSRYVLACQTSLAL